MQVTDEMVRVAVKAYTEKCGGYYAAGFMPMEAALTAALAAMWQPIETHQGDSDSVFLSSTFRVGEGTWGICRKQDGGYRANNGEPTWRTPDETYRFPGKVTHWMPLPPAPTQLSMRGDAEKTAEG